MDICPCKALKNVRWDAGKLREEIIDFHRCNKMRSAFIRKMALDGYIIKLDTSDIREMISLLRHSSNNLNQIAKKANSTGTIYGADIADLQVKQDEIWELAREIAARLSTIQ